MFFLYKNKPYALQQKRRRRRVIQPFIPLLMQSLHPSRGPAG